MHKIVLPLKPVENKVAIVRSRHKNFTIILSTEGPIILGLPEIIKKKLLESLKSCEEEFISVKIFLKDSKSELAKTLETDYSLINFLADICFLTKNGTVYRCILINSQMLAIRKISYLENIVDMDAPYLGNLTFFLSSEGNLLEESCYRKLSVKNRFKKIPLGQLSKAKCITIKSGYKKTLLKFDNGLIGISDDYVFSIHPWNYSPNKPEMFKTLKIVDFMSGYEIRNMKDNFLLSNGKLLIYEHETKTYKISDKCGKIISLHTNPRHNMYGYITETNDIFFQFQTKKTLLKITYFAKNKIKITQIYFDIYLDKPSIIFVDKYGHLYDIKNISTKKVTHLPYKVFPSKKMQEKIKVMKERFEFLSDSKEPICFF